jgi:hypothetical protein
LLRIKSWTNWPDMLPAPKIPQLIEDMCREM